MIKISKKLRIVALVSVFVLSFVAAWFSTSSETGAIWNADGKNKSWIYEQSATDSCGLGHCPVLPATSASTCTSGYSYNATTKDCEKSSSKVCPSGWSTSSTGSCYQLSGRPVTGATRNACPYGGTYDSAKGKCYKLATSPPGVSILLCTLGNYPSQGYVDKVGVRCYQKNGPGYTYSYGSCSPGYVYSSDSSKCIRYTSKVCNVGTERSGECIETASPRSGDAIYALWAIVRSGDTDNAYFTGSAKSESKANALVDLLVSYYNGTHTNIKKFATSTGASEATVKNYAKSGVTFVVQSMLGRSQGSIVDGDGNKVAVVTNEEFDSLRSILVSLANYIDWSGKVTGTDYNTHAVKVTYKGSSKFDIAQGSDKVTNRSAIKIKDAKGSVLFTLFYACANPYGSGNEGVGDFNLTPKISTGVNGVIESQSALSVNPSVDNTGDRDSVDTYWQVSRFILSPSASKPVKSDGTSNNPAQYLSGVTGLTDIGHGNISFPTPSYNITSILDTVPIAPIGSKVCYVTSVQGYNVGTSDWRHSAPACLVIGLKPKIQVWGSDLIAGNTIIGSYTNSQLSDVQTNTSIRNVAGSLVTYGSWVEYGVRATGQVTGLGSGSSYSGGLVNSTDCKAGMLTFTNGGSSTCEQSGGKFGNYRSSQQLSDIASSFVVGSGTPSLSDTASVGDLNGLYRASGNLILQGGEVGLGKWAVINAPEANITIAGDIRYYSGKINNLRDIPQLVIIAKNITIAESVTQVDAWLIAKKTTNEVDAGVISTCVFNSDDQNYVSFSSFPPFPSNEDISRLGLNSRTCNQKLTVNGPVVANKLYLLRTSGGFDDPSELFNLRPDSYIWSYLRSLGDNRAQTVYSTELPPRL